MAYKKSKKEDSHDLEEENLKTVIAKRKLAELKVGKEESKLVEAKAVEKEWQAMCLSFRNKMLAIPTVHAPQLADTTNISEVEYLLKNAISDALKELVKEETVDK